MGAKIKEQNQDIKPSLPIQHPQSLELRISPHFFFNILNSIYHSIKLNPDQAENILLKFSELMQYYVYDCLDEKILLEKEIKNIRNFIGLQKMRVPFKLQEDFIVRGHIGNLLISPSVFMEVVENVFKNEILNANPESSLEIDFLIKDTQVILRLSYSGSSDSGNFSFELEKSFSALQNRLQSLYPESHILQMNKSDKVRSILLQIQLNQSA